MAMYHRPIRLFPDGPEYDEPIASDDEGIVFHVPLRTEDCHLASAVYPSNFSYTSSSDERQCVRITSTHSHEVEVEGVCEEDACEQQLMKEEFFVLENDVREVKIHKDSEVHEEPHWIKNRRANNSFVSAVSFLYAILVVGYVIVEETAYEENSGDVRQIFPPGSAFHYYMYIVGIGYIVYANLFIIHTSWLNRLFQYLTDKGWWENANKHLITSVPHKSYTGASLYLRVGTAFFGCGGVVLYGLNIFLLFSNRISTHHKNPSVAENIFGAMFTFLQTYFIAVNKQSIDSSSNVCRFGFMHNFSLNLWIWHRYSTAKQLDHEAKNNSMAKDVAVFKFPGEYHEIIDVLEYYGAFAGLLDTFLVEYSVIGAAVMFVHWRHLDDPVKPFERLQLPRTNFSHTFAGICFAVVIFVLGAVVCGVYSAVAKDEDAYLLLGIYDSVCYVCCIAAVLSAMIFMRSHVRAYGDEAEDVDRILLYIVFVGELVWCSAELARFIDGQDQHEKAGKQRWFIFAVTILRLVHVFSQTWFILISSKLALPPSSNHVSMKGRQCVTFLIVNNLTLFFFHIYSSITAGFHSTVCLTKIWTKSFALPNMNNVHNNE